ncbi:glycosyl hydrolase family 18 protein [Nocardia coffeae]|uniref:glycosyl hydrolase family 18 protein n=1 Tax=Nocardia coffeae TaxID=2873381 RepID=UPI0027DFE0E1|nr:glycosyl hydrolase family 18 protein [Nocardia coffeae]
MGAWWRGWSWWRRVLAVVVLVVVVVMVVVGVGVVGLLVEDAGTPAAGAHTRGRDAYWLGHAWVDGRKGEADVAALAKQLSGTGVRDLYVHTGPLSDDGGVRAELFSRAGWFVAAVHRMAPGVRVQSWLGDVVAPAFDGLHMNDPATRDRFAGSVARVLELGFDGVHLDLEPVRSGSPDYLTMLDRARAVTSARHALLSVSTPQLEPLPGVHHVGAVLTGNGKYWSRGYFADVARRVDQLAVMSYDTWMPWRPLYSGYVAEQTALALEAAPATVDLLMGVPAYWADDYGHHGNAETVPAALRGIRLGLGRTAPGRESFGVAMYVDFTATSQNWSDYRRDWGAVRG